MRSADSKQTRVSSFGIARPYILLEYTLFAIVVIVVLHAAPVAACGLFRAAVFLLLPLV